MTNIKNSLVEQIEQDKLLSDARNEAEEKFRSNRSALEKSIESLIDRTLREFSLENNVNIHFSFWSSDAKGNTFRDPHFSIHYLAEGDHRLSQSYWVNIDGKWICHRKHPGGKDVYLHDLNFEAKLKTINLDYLNQVCNILTSKTACRVQSIPRTVVKANNIKIPKSLDDLLVIHPCSRIVASGEKWHEGWDISDPWAVVQTKKAHLVIYYSTNGHGFGYDTCVMPDKSTSDFFYWLVGKDMVKLQSLIPTNILKKLEARGP